jgi:hypothetical protein
MTRTTFAIEIISETTIAHDMSSKKTRKAEVQHLGHSLKRKEIMQLFTLMVHPTVYFFESFCCQ